MKLHRHDHQFCAIRGDADTGSGLPGDLRLRCCRRLGWAAFIYALCYSIAFTTEMVTTSGEQIPSLGLSLAIAGTSVGMSLLVALMAGFHRIPPERLDDLGLTYEVVAAAGIDARLIWYPIEPGYNPVGVSWVGVWLITFAAIVPSTIGKTLLAAVAGASVTPLFLLIGMARGSADLSLGTFVQWSVPNYLCALLAVAVSRIVYSLGRQVQQARNMGSYQLVELLGHGGMGEVWRARHQMLARDAAVKLIRPSFLAGSNETDLDLIFRRFEREARATAALRSPHTVTLFDFGRAGDGTFYYVMELLEGIDLEHMVQKFGPITPSRTVYLLRQACHSLGEAHAQSFIHRDIKPANLYTCHLGPDFDFLKVMDFGLVKRAGKASRDESRLTGVGSFPGTPAYMAPELIMGEEGVDGRADLYALGCVGYWLLTGEPVFSGKTFMEVSLNHLQAAPVPPSERLGEKLPESLEEVILDCLEKDREQRPSSMGELAARLEACSCGPVWDQEQAGRWWKDHLATA